MNEHDTKMGALIDQYRAIIDAARALERLAIMSDLSATARIWAQTCAGAWPGELGAARCFAFSDIPSNPRASTWWQA